MLVHRYGAGQLKVMFVGGPNVRKDYHIDEGEEVRIVILQDNTECKNKKHATYCL